jgi:ssDNA-binding Zn-finger/Zn-ribbon topoisomerase 1
LNCIQNPKAFSDDCEVSVIGKSSKPTKCPECQIGNIQAIAWNDSFFYSCYNYSYCRYRPQTCPKCINGFLRKISETKYASVNDHCDFEARISPACNEDYLNIVNGPYSDFLGFACFLVCSHKEKIV